MAKNAASNLSKSHRPFVCGLCMSGFNNIDLFHTHFKKHCDVVKKECFHACDLKELQQLSRQEVVIGSDLQTGTFTCMGCSHAFPTICQLNKHLSVGSVTSGSYVFDIKSSSAFPTLNECPDKKKVVAEEGNKSVRKSPRTRNKNNKSDENQTLGKSNSFEDPNKDADPSVKPLNCPDIATKNLKQITNKDHDQDLQFLEPGQRITSENLKGKNGNLIRKQCSGKDDEAEAEVTFAALHDLPTKGLRDEFSRLSNGGMLKCMVKFQTFRMFSDKGCQVNISENSFNENWIEKSVETNSEERKRRNAIATRNCKEDRKKLTYAQGDNTLKEADLKVKKRSQLPKQADSNNSNDTLSEDSSADSVMEVIPDSESTSTGDTSADQSYHDSILAEKGDECDISDKNTDGDDDDDYIDNEDETVESDMEPIENMKKGVYPENDFASETIGKKKLLFCEVCNEKFEQCYLIKHIEECHTDEEISDSFRQKLLKLTLMFKSKSKKKIHGNKRRRLRKSVKESVAFSSDSKGDHSTKLGLNKSTNGQYSSLVTEKNDKDSSFEELLEDTETGTTTQKLPLKSVFRKIDKHCTQQAVKTTKKKFFPCKICGVLVQSYKLQEHEGMHNTKAGKLLFSPNNLEECKTCGRVLLKRSFAKHMCLLINTGDSNEVDTAVGQAEQTNSSPHSSRETKRLKRVLNVNKHKSNEMLRKKFIRDETNFDSNSVESGPVDNTNPNQTQNPDASLTHKLNDNGTKHPSEETDHSVSCTDELNSSVLSLSSNLGSVGKSQPSENSREALKKKSPASISMADPTKNTELIKKYFAERSTNFTRRKKFIKCKQCGMYVRYDRLKKHNEMHRRCPQRFEKLVECEQCGRKLFQKNLNKHQCATGLKVSERKYKRRACRKEILEEINSEKEQSVDVGVDVKQCSSPRETQSKVEKKAKQKKKGVNQRWLCYECGKSFKTERTFIRHRDKKHKLLVFMCHICMKMLSSAAALEQHVKIHAVSDTHQPESEQAKLLLKTARAKQASHSPRKVISPDHSKSQETPSQSARVKATRVFIPGQAETDKAVESILVDNSHHDLMISPSPSINFSNNTIDNSF